MNVHTRELPRAVAEARITCTSCPWQAEGRIWDGPRFYLRIRSGRASLGFGVNDDAAAEDAMWGARHVFDREFGGAHEVPWAPTDAEAWALFDVLLALPKASP
jgi:hypothetical protein